MNCFLPLDNDSVIQSLLFKHTHVHFSFETTIMEIKLLLHNSVNHPEF